MIGLSLWLAIYQQNKKEVVHQGRFLLCFFEFFLAFDDILPNKCSESFGAFLTSGFVIVASSS